MPGDHPLRSIKVHADSALKEIRPLLDDLYSEIDRPSIQPERQLKAQLLIALYIEAGSFVRAAERRDLSAAMASKHIVHVERRLGVRLLRPNKIRAFIDFIHEALSSMPAPEVIVPKQSLSIRAAMG